MKSLIALLLVFVTCMFGLPTASASPSVPVPVPVASYDAHPQGVESAHTVPARDPPAHTYGYNAYGPVDRWSRGALARCGRAPSPVTCTYDDTARHAQVARGVASTESREGRPVGAMSPAGGAKSFLR